MSLGFSRRDARFCGMGQQPGVILLVLLMFFSAIGMRLVWMQLLHGAENRVAADENRIRLMPRSPIRGRLLDRKGRVLASSKLTYTLFIEPRLVTDEQWPALRDRLVCVVDEKCNGVCHTFVFLSPSSKSLAARSMSGRSVSISPFQCTSAKKAR